MFDKKEVKKEEKKIDTSYKPEKLPKGTKKIGSIPLGYTEKDEVFMKGAKIYIRKKK